MNLEGRTAMVTGGAAGIGLAVARALAAEGAAVALLDQDGDGARTRASEIKSYGGVEALGVDADVRCPEEIRAAVDRTERELGPVDILVNNTGIWRRTPILSVEESLWDDIFAVNVKGVLHCSQTVGARMVQRRRGKIVVIASMAAFGGGNEWGAYCASKAAAVSLTQTLADELGPFGVHVNAVCPGATDTELARQIIREQPGTTFEYHQPEDVAAEVLDLVIPFSQTRTGQIVRMK